MADLETQIRSLADRRFAATSPVTFVADSTTEDGTPSHETEIIMRSNETARPPRRWYILGAAAGLVAVAVVGIALFREDSDPPAPAATTPLVTSAATLPAVEPESIELTGVEGDATEAGAALAVITAAYDAFNAGDGLRWATARNAPETAPADLDDPLVQYVVALHAAGARYEVTSCDHQRFDDALGGDLGVDTRHKFLCDAKMVDEFTAAAGLDFDEEFTWTVAEGRVIDATSSFADLNILQEFMADLRDWVEREHPDIAFTAIERYNYPLAAEVPAVVQLVGEFVAVDDRYPLTGE